MLAWHDVLDVKRDQRRICRWQYSQRFSARSKTVFRSVESIAYGWREVRRKRASA
jgi:hypothetical protein